ncbi:unnamed protein product [Fraxinus pennsylvanica]|uniref:C2H2-type domain-containing protein n=1 Tax=Fraxinus pennsylvanica TaxID=56036 RepID=A0AAD2E7N5_9LAMI|nr:unnamed protein product [Fraxinus pennsylvanica]
MKENQELRFVCKLCNKKYSCGKSLGGHMRSHLVANSVESEEKFQSKMKKISSSGSSGKNIIKESRVVDDFGNGQSNFYGLRENPKKTWRAEDSKFPLPQEKFCKQCGKGFQSLKALCGHMACHSEKERGLKDDHSWTSENQKVVMDSDLDAESEDRKRLRNTRSSLKCKWYKKIVVNGFSLVDDFGNVQSNFYGLRENHKKSWRAEDSKYPLPQEKFCKQCGKGFQSLKALCGHMACHSEKERGLKDDHSWTSENQKVVMDSDLDAESEDRKRLRNTRSSLKCKWYKKIVVNGFSSRGSDIEEQEKEDLAMCLMMLSRDSGNRGGVNSIMESSDNNSVALETKSSSLDIRIDRKEGLNYVLNKDEAPRMKKIGDMKSKNSVLDGEIAQVDSSDSEYFLDECTKIESDVYMNRCHSNGGSGACNKPLMIWTRMKSYKTDLSRDNMKENGSVNAERESNYSKTKSQKRKYTSESPKNGSPDAKISNQIQKKSKYECLNCQKTFNSYQALGGHRPCQKTSNAHFEVRYGTGENSSDDATYFRTIDNFGELSSRNRKPTAETSSQYAEKRIKPMQSKDHVCPFCHRSFKNGQALGGHKRSHIINGHEENSSRTPINKPELPHLLDLNLSAPAKDEDYGHGQLFAS